MARRLLRWLLPALVVLLWLGLGGPLGSFNGKLSAVQENDNAAFLPDGAESTRVTELLRGFDTDGSVPVLLLWGSHRGPVDEAARAQIAQRLDEAVRIADSANASTGEASPPIPSADGKAVEAVIPVRPDLGEALGDLITQLRGLPGIPGTTAYVTGPGGLFADFADGVAGIGGMLLLPGFGVVLLILVAVYRSPILQLLVIGTAGLALSAS